MVGGRVRMEKEAMNEEAMLKATEEETRVKQSTREGKSSKK